MTRSTSACTRRRASPLTFSTCPRSHRLARLARPGLDLVPSLASRRPAPRPAPPSPPRRGAARRAGRPRRRPRRGRASGPPRGRGSRPWRASRRSARPVRRRPGSARRCRPGAAPAARRPAATACSSVPSGGASARAPARRPTPPCLRRCASQSSVPGSDGSGVGVSRGSPRRRPSRPRIPLRLAIERRRRLWDAARAPAPLHPVPVGVSADSLRMRARIVTSAVLFGRTIAPTIGGATRSGARPVARERSRDVRHIRPHPRQAVHRLRAGPRPDSPPSADRGPSSTSAWSCWSPP